MFLGVCDLRTHLRNHNIDAEIFDADVAEFASRQNNEPTYESIVKDTLKSYAPAYVGIHVNTPNYQSSLDLVRLIKKILPDCTIIAGGPHATAAWQELLLNHPEIDFACVGEGEQPLTDFIENYNAVTPEIFPSGIAGRISGRPQMRPRELLPSFSLPCSDRSAFLNTPFPLLNKWAKLRYMDNFYNAIRSFDGRLATNIYASRGCSRCCPFCSPGTFWLSPINKTPSQRIKQIQTLETEFKYLKESGYGAVYFDEMAFPFYCQSWVKEFLPAIKKYDLLWGGAAIFDQVKEIDLHSFASFGLRYLYFGFETPHSRLQKAVGKETNEDALLAFMEKAYQAGIHCDLSMFFGGPGETDSTIIETIDWLNANLPRGNAFFSTAAIWPATKWASDLNLSGRNWEPSFDKEALSDKVCWFSHDMKSVGQFFSNSLGTYHPKFLSEEKALWIKSLIIESGFRKRFATYSRSINR